MAVKMYLPAGRIVQGSPTFKQDKDPQGRPKEKPNWFLAVAVPKTDPEVGGIINQIMQIAWAGYQSAPQVLEMIKPGLAGPFHWKIEDGDGSKAQGKEGYAGCWVFKLSTSLGVISCCNAQNQLIDPSLVKCGYCVDVGISVDINKNVDSTAGVYLNPEMVRLLGYLPEIQSGPTPEQTFAGRPATVPQGVSATPLSPAGGMVGFSGGAGTGGPVVGGTAGPGFPMSPAGGQAVPGTAGPGPAHSAGAPGFPATASPSNQYPGATPYPAFLGTK
jgi:hypothetical protein